MLSTVVQITVCMHHTSFHGCRYGYGETVRRRYAPEWLVTLLLSRISLSLSLRVCVYELSPETCSSGFEDYSLAPKRIDVLTQE